MQMMSLGSGGLQSEINVTPLVDVVLVLLIIFMVIVPLTLNSYDVAIPTESAATPPVERPEVEQVVLTIDPESCPALEVVASPGLPANCRVSLNDESLDASELPQRVGEVFAERAADDRVLFLAADDRLNYEAVMRIVDAAKSGVPELRIGIVTADRASL